jgi:hypothetical protein
MSLRLKLGGIFLAAVAVRVAFHLLTGFTADDAFITFRYAESLAGGLGFVYNAGEHVLGTSTPLFTWLLAVLALIRIPIVTGALLVSLVCSGLTACVLYRLSNNLRFGSLSWLPTLAYIVWPRSIPAETCGMETALFTLLVTATFYYHHRQLRYYAIGLATLATLTRPEGIVVLCLLLVSSCWKDRHFWKSYLIVPALLLIPWLLVAQFYFGSVLPHSMTAKLALYSRFGTDSVWDNLVYLLGWHNPVGWLMFPAAVIGGWWLYRKQNFGALEACWLIVSMIAYAFSGTRLFFWYVAPLYPLYLLFALAAAVWVCERSQFLRYRPRALAAIVSALLLILSVVGLYRQVDHFRIMQAYSDEVLKPVAAYLRENANVPSELVAAEDIGYIGYYSKCRILDRDGLVSPTSVAYNRDARYFDLILHIRPDWVGTAVGSPISGFINDPQFLADYELAHAFGGNIVPSYNLYRRIP